MDEEPGCTIEKRFSFKRSEDCVEEDLDNPKTKGFFFDRSKNKKACTYNESCIEIVDVNEGRIKRSFDVKQYFNDDTFKIECVIPLDIEPKSNHPAGLASDTFMFPLLLVGCSYSTGGMVMILPTYVDTVVRMIKIPNKVTSICPVTVESVTPSSRITLPSSLQLLSGTVAIGTQCGTVYLVELQRDTFLASYRSPEPQDPLDLLVKVYSDLDTSEKVEHAQLDDSAHIALALNSVSAHNGLFFIQLPSNKICTKPFHQEDVHVSRLYVIEEANLLVVAYLLRKQCETGGEVFVYKNVLQLWDLAKLELVFTSGLWDACEITHLMHQIASDDPYASLYLHVACRTIDEDYPTPFMLLYECRFQTKDVDPDTKVVTFEVFLECAKRFEWYMSTPDLPHGRLLSLSSLPSLSEDKQIALYFTSMFSSLSSSHRSLLYLFDLNQWFSAQMPGEYSTRSGPFYTAQYDLTQVLDERALPMCIDVLRSEDNIYTSRNPRIQFDSYYFPNACSFHSLCLLESEIVALSHLGVHEKAIKLMTHAGAASLIQPARYFELASRIHLQPLFMDPVASYHRLDQYSQEEQRKFLLSLLFDLLDDLSFETFLGSCAQEWSLGTFDAAGCSVTLLVGWAWEHVTRGKQYVDKLCISLFDFSGLEALDPRDASLLKRYSRQLDTVLRLYRRLGADNPLLSLSAGLEQRTRTLTTLAAYYKTLGGLMYKRLLPEAHGLEVWEKGGAGKRIPYPVRVIREYADQRRTDLSSLAAHSLLSIPPSGLYMIDALACHLAQGRLNLLAEQWGQGAPTEPLYPPPSLQSLLRMYLIEELPLHVKDMLLYYVKLDVQHFMPVPKNKEEESMLNHLTVYEFLAEEYRHMVRGVWCLDHNRWSDAYDHLKKASKYTRVPTWLHYSTILLLLLKREKQLAYQYTCDFQPECSTQDHVKIQLTAFLNAGRLQKALDFLKGSEFESPPLLTYLFESAREMSALPELCGLRHLTPFEENELRKYLEKQKTLYTDYLWINFLYSKSRYCEAFEYKDAVKRKHASHLSGSSILGGANSMSGGTSIVAGANSTVGGANSTKGGANSIVGGGSSLAQTGDMQRFIWRTEKQVDYMYKRCVPQLVKEEYLSGKRNGVHRVEPELDRSTAQSRKRGPDSSPQALETSATTKRTRYAFEFSFAPTPKPAPRDDQLGANEGDGSLLLPAPDPNISALLSTPFVHKKADRPPLELEAVAPGSTQKPNKSLLKTPGSVSGSVKKALSFASLDKTPDEEQVGGAKYSKALNFGSPPTRSTAAGKSDHSKALNFSAEDDEEEGQQDQSTLSKIKHLADPARTEDEITVANENEEEEEAMECGEDNEDANSLISEDLSYYDVVGRPPIRSELSVIKEVSSESSFQSADDSGDEFPPASNTSTTTVDIEPLTTSHHQSTITNISSTTTGNLSSSFASFSSSTRHSVTLGDVSKLSTASNASSTASYVSTMSSMKPSADVTLAEDSNFGSEMGGDDGQVNYGGNEVTLGSERVEENEVEKKDNASMEKEEVEKGDESLEEASKEKAGRSSQKESPPVTPRKGSRGDVAKSLIEEEHASPRRVSPRQHASTKVVLSGSPNATTTPTPATPKSTRKSRAQTMLPEAEDTPTRRMTRSRKSSVSSVESATRRTRRSESQEPEPAADVRRTRRSMSREPEQNASDPPSSIKHGLRSSSVSSLDSEASKPAATTTPRKSMRKSVSSADVSASPRTRQSRRSSISEDAEAQPKRNLRSASVSSLSSVESAESSAAAGSLKTPRKMSTRRSTSKLQPIAETGENGAAKMETLVDTAHTGEEDIPELQSQPNVEQGSVEIEPSEGEEALKHDGDVEESVQSSTTGEVAAEKCPEDTHSVPSDSHGQQPVIDESGKPTADSTSLFSEPISYDEGTAESEIASDPDVDRQSLEVENASIDAEYSNSGTEITTWSQKSEMSAVSNMKAETVSQSFSIQEREQYETPERVTIVQGNVFGTSITSVQPCEQSKLEPSATYEQLPAHEENVAKKEEAQSLNAGNTLEEEPMEVCEEVEVSTPAIDTSQIKSILDSVNMADIVKIANAQKDLAKPEVSTEPKTESESFFGTSFQASSQSVFGTPAQSQGSLFGHSAQTQANLFGTPGQSQGSLFGPSAKSQGSFFGTPARSQQGSFFGPTAQSQVPAMGSLFGPSAQSQQVGGLFGPATPSQAPAMDSFFKPNSGSFFGTATTTPPGPNRSTVDGQSTIVSPSWNFSPKINSVKTEKEPTETPSDPPSTKTYVELEPPSCETPAEELTDQVNVSLPLFKIGHVKSISNESFMKIGDRSVHQTIVEEQTPQETAGLERDVKDEPLESNTAEKTPEQNRLDATIELDLSDAAKSANNTILLDSSKERSFKEEDDRDEAECKQEEDWDEEEEEASRSSEDSSTSGSSKNSASGNRNSPQPKVEPKIEPKTENGDSDSDIVIIDSEEEGESAANAKPAVPVRKHHTDSESIESEEDIEEEEEEEYSDEEDSFDEEEDDENEDGGEFEGEEGVDEEENDQDEMFEEEGEEEESGAEERSETRGERRGEDDGEVEEESEVEEDSEIEIVSSDGEPDQMVPESMRQDSGRSKHEESFGMDGEANVSEIPVNYSRLGGYDVSATEVDPLSMTRVEEMEDDVVGNVTGRDSATGTKGEESVIEGNEGGEETSPPEGKVGGEETPAKNVFQVPNDGVAASKNETSLSLASETTRPVERVEEIAQISEADDAVSKETEDSEMLCESNKVQSNTLEAAQSSIVANTTASPSKTNELNNSVAQETSVSQPHERVPQLPIQEDEEMKEVYYENTRETSIQQKVSGRTPTNVFVESKAVGSPILKGSPLRGADMSIEFSEPFNVSSAEAANVLQSMRDKVINPPEAEEVDSAEEDFFTRENYNYNITPNDISFEMSKRFKEKSVADNIANEEKPTLKMSSLKSVRLESHGVKVASSQPEVVAAQTNSNEADGSVHQSERSHPVQTGKAQVNEQVTYAHDQAIHLTNNSETSSPSQNKDQTVREKVNEVSLQHTDASNESETTNMVDKSSDKVVNKSEVVVNARKSGVKSPRKSLLLKKTFEQTVFLPESDSESDEPSHTKVESDTSMSMMFPEQTLNTTESPNNGHRSMMSHKFKDQTVFLPYSDSETESSFVDNVTDVYNVRNSVTNLLATIEKSPNQSLSKTVHHKQSTNKTDSVSPNKKMVSIVNSRLFDSFNDTIEKENDASRTEKPSKINERKSETIEATKRAKAETEDAVKHDELVPTKNTNVNVVSSHQINLTKGSAAPDTKEPTETVQTKVNQMKDAADMEVDFEEDSNGDVLIINEDFAEPEESDNQDSNTSEVTNKVIEDKKIVNTIASASEKDQSDRVSKEPEESDKQDSNTSEVTSKVIEEDKKIGNKSEKGQSGSVSKEPEQKDEAVKEESIKDDKEENMETEADSKSDQQTEAVTSDTISKLEAFEKSSEVSVMKVEDEFNKTPEETKPAVTDATKKSPESADISKEPKSESKVATTSRSTRLEAPQKPVSESPVKEAKTPPKPASIKELDQKTPLKDSPETANVSNDSTESNAAKSQPAVSTVITPKSVRKTRKQATPLVKEVLSKSELKNEVLAAKNEVTPVKGKSSGDVLTPVSLRRSSRKTSNVSADAGTPVEGTPTRTLRRRTPSVSSEAGSQDTDLPKRYALRKRTSSISSDTSMIEDVEAAATPVVRRKTPARGRTPSFDVDAEGDSKRTPLKSGKSRSPDSSVTPRSTRATRNRTPNLSLIGKRNEMDLEDGSESESDDGDKRGWQHERTRLTEFNLDSEEEDEEELINFDDIDETRLILPEYLKTPGGKKKKGGAKQKESPEEEEEIDEKARTNKRKSKIFHAKDATGTPTKRMKMRPSTLAKIPEEKDTETDKTKGKSDNEPAKPETKGVQEEDVEKGSKRAETSLKKSAKKETATKSEKASNKEDEEASTATTKSDEAARTKRGSKASASSKLEPINEVKKDAGEKSSTKESQANKQEDEATKGKESVQKVGDEGVKGPGDDKVPPRALSRRESRALYAARKSSKLMDVSTASTASNVTARSSVTGRNDTTGTKGSSSVYMQSLLNSVKPETASSMMNKMRSSNVRARQSRARGASRRDAEEVEDEEEDIESTTTRSSESSTKKSRTPVPPVVKSWPLRSRRSSAGSEATSSQAPSVSGHSEVEEDDAGEDSTAVKRTKRGRESNDSPIPVSVEEITKKRRITRNQLSSLVKQSTRAGASMDTTISEEDHEPASKDGKPSKRK